MAAGLAKGFAGPGFLEQVRDQPSSFVAERLGSQIEKFDPAVIERRRSRGEHLARAISDENGVSSDWVSFRLMQRIGFLLP